MIAELSSAVTTNACHSEKVIYIICIVAQRLMPPSITCRLEQQIAALDQLQEVLDQAPRKMPCPGMAAAQQASRPDMLTYMASSRFGPALLSSLAEQVGLGRKQLIHSLLCNAVQKKFLSRNQQGKLDASLALKASKPFTCMAVSCGLSASWLACSGKCWNAHVWHACRLLRMLLTPRHGMRWTWTICSLGTSRTGGTRPLRLTAAAPASSP